MRHTGLIIRLTDDMHRADLEQRERQHVGRLGARTRDLAAGADVQAQHHVGAPRTPARPGPSGRSSTTAGRAAPCSPGTTGPGPPARRSDGSRPPRARGPTAGEMIVGHEHAGGPAGHHSSMTKSLYAVTHTSASSLSLNVEEQRAGEPGQRREQDAGEDPVGEHVLGPLLRVVAAGPHLGEADRVGVVLVAGLADDGVEAHRLAALRPRRPSTRGRRLRPRGAQPGGTSPAPGPATPRPAR